MKKVKLIIKTAFIPFVFAMYNPLFSLPNINGSLDTTVYIYSSENEDFTGTETKSKISETLFLNADLYKNLSFHTNNRFNYWTAENDNPDRYEINLYYGYVDYAPLENFNTQLGRIMDLNSLMYSIYDGANFEFLFNIFDTKLTLDIYGGLVVNDDYLENDDPYGNNSFDYRNIFNFDKVSNYRDLLMKERKGDYICGTKADFLLKNIGIFAVEYQSTYNQYDLAEQYVSLDFDTLFSKKIVLYGYGVIDLIDKKPSNTLAAAQYNYSDFLSVILEHEYFRPVYIKDSYFWSYFEPYGYQQASGTFIFNISKLLKVDIKYGKIIYDAESKTGDEYSANITHRNIYGFTVNLNGDYYTGPEGDQILSEATLNKRISIFDLFAGGGIIYYSDKNLSHTLDTDYFSKNYREIKNSFNDGYYGSLEAEMNILKNLIFSATGEYYNNPKYYYDLRGILSLKYIF